LPGLVGASGPADGIGNGGAVGGWFGLVSDAGGAEGFCEWVAAGGTPGLTEPDNGTAKPSPGTGASTGGGKRFSVWQAASQSSHTKPTGMFNQDLCLFAWGL
jgi:hypothetical protein